MKLRWLCPSLLFTATEASCCNHVVMRNGRIKEGIYTHNGRFVNGRPMYEDSIKIRALWFNNDGWKSGYYSTLYPNVGLKSSTPSGEPNNHLSGNFDTAYLSTDETPDCPQDVTTWKTESDLTVGQPSEYGPLNPLIFTGLRCGTTYDRDCNRESIMHCCSPWGWCGGTAAHCSCNGCINYVEEEIKAYTNNWSVDSSVSVTCYEPAMDCCEALEISNDLGTNMRYTWNGNFAYGRPVYIDSTGQTSFWNNGRSDSFTWMLTDTTTLEDKITHEGKWPNMLAHGAYQIPGNTVKMVGEGLSPLTCPEDFGYGNWLERRDPGGGEWWANNEIVVKCAGKDDPDPPVVPTTNPQLRVWHGDTDMATWEFIGGYRDFHGDFHAMFDNVYHNLNMYHSTTCTEERGVVITFANPVQYEDLQIYTRQKCCRDVRYNGVCLYADGVKISCTPSNLGDPGETINFKDYNFVAASTVGPATEYRLMWDDPDSSCAQIEELFFHYISSGGNGDECKNSGDCRTGWICNFDNTDSGFCEDCNSFDTDNGCYKTGFISNLGTQECMQRCTQVNNRDPKKLLTGIVKRLMRFTAENLSGDFVTKFEGKLEKLTFRMETKLTQLEDNGKCKFSKIEDDADTTRYSMDNPCKATDQLMKQLTKWAKTFTVNCKNGSVRFFESIQGKLDTFQRRIHRKLKIC